MYYLDLLNVRSLTNLRCTNPEILAKKHMESIINIQNVKLVGVVQIYAYRLLKGGGGKSKYKQSVSKTFLRYHK